MRKKISLYLFIFLFGIINPVFGQDVFLEQQLSFKKTGSLIKGVLPVVNEQNKDFALFFNETKSVFAYLFNKNKVKIGEIDANEIPRKYKILLGYKIDKENRRYTIFSSNNKRTAFLVTSFDFEAETAESKEIRLPIQTELYVQSLNLDNDLIFITITKNSSILNFYTFEDTFRYKKHALELKDFAFLNKNGKRTSLYKLLTGISDTSLKQVSFSDLSFEMIDTSLPVPIEAATNANKLYLADNNARFTFDGNNDSLQMLDINLKSFEWGKKIVEKPMLKIPRSEKKTNSFILDNYLFLIGCSKRGLLVKIQDLHSNEVLKTHSVLVNETINISNTPIIQEGGFYDNHREFDRTDKFIRKVFSSNVGLALNRLGENYAITFGGSKIAPRGGMPIMPLPMGGMPLGSIGAVDFNLTMNYYNYHRNDKSIYFTGLFNDNFEHIDGELELSPFDHIDNYKEYRRKETYVETIFKYDNMVIWGEYSPTNKTYILRSF